ncbi:MAG TPA: BON domain-containing protein [Fibrobacteria bacterium]|nr:BON domain-containing protein [Fibrobacteria bacterium]
MNRSQRIFPTGSSFLGRALTAAAGAALGAGLAHFLDPASGGRRRARLSGRAARVFREATRSIHRVSSDLSGRVHGLLPRLRNLVRYEPAEDEILRERVRSKAGHFLTHPRAVEVETRDGVVTLSGEASAFESERLVFHARFLPGVRIVRNHVMDPLYGKPETALPEGPRFPGRPRPGRRAAAPWSPAIRFSAFALGISLALLGLARRGAPGFLLSAAGSGMAWLGLRGKSRADGSGTGRSRIGSRFNPAHPNRAPRGNRWSGSNPRGC